MLSTSTQCQSSYQGTSLEEREAASIVAALYSTTARCKREREKDEDVAGATRFPKKSTQYENSEVVVDVAVAAVGVAKLNETEDSKEGNDENPKAKPKSPPMDATGLVFAPVMLKPAPYFYYTDHSLEADDDPLTPLTTAGRIPTFPASEFIHSVSY